jgi:hypothetical protein
MWSVGVLMCAREEWCAVVLGGGGGVDGAGRKDLGNRGGIQAVRWAGQEDAK